MLYLGGLSKRITSCRSWMSVTNNRRMENGAAMGPVEDSFEFKLLMAYASRRRPPSKRDKMIMSETLDKGEGNGKKRMAKKKQGKLKLKMLSCISVRPKKPQSHQEEPIHQMFRCLNGEDDAGRVAEQLTKIVDSVPILSHPSDDIESDGLHSEDSTDDVIEAIVKILRESGDKFNEEIQKNKALAKKLHNCFDYNIFERVTQSYLDCASHGDKEPVKIALAFEVTSRLTVLDNHPMNRVMGFGVKYLQTKFSAWVQLNGGWKHAFDGMDDEDEVQ